MPCPHNETLMAFAAAELPPDERRAVSTHLDVCRACERVVASVHTVRALAREPLLEDPPESVLRLAVRVPQPSEASLIRRLGGTIAALVFDAGRDPLPAGVRSGPSAGRQILYRALDYDVDIRVVASGPEQVRISGQVLPGPDRPMGAVAGIEIALVSPSGTTELCDTSELGEFSFAASAEGAYSLYVETAEERLVIENLHANSA